MASQQKLRKSRLEEKLGLKQADIIKSNFDTEILDIAWDILNGKWDLREHPRVKDEPEVDWVFFLIINNLHASVWAVEGKFLKSHQVVDQDYITAFDVNDCLKETATIRRYHIILCDDKYYAQADEVYIKQGKPAEFDICLYIGTITTCLKGLDVIMVMIADKTYLLLETDCLEYCKNFVATYFELIEEEMTYEQKATLRKLTVTNNILSQISERSGRQHWLSGLSLRSMLISPFTQTFLATIIANGIIIFFVIKYRK